MCSVILYRVMWCMTCPLGDPFLSLYTPEKKGYKQNSLFGTITISSTSCNLMIYALILWTGSPQMVRPCTILWYRGFIPPHGLISFYMIGNIVAQMPTLPRMSFFFPSFSTICIFNYIRGHV
jgi:hypothetical protein